MWLTYSSIFSPTVPAQRKKYKLARRSLTEISFAPVDMLFRILNAESSPTNGKNLFSIYMRMNTWTTTINVSIWTYINAFTRRRKEIAKVLRITELFLSNIIVCGFISCYKVKILSIFWKFHFAIVSLKYDQLSEYNQSIIAELIYSLKVVQFSEGGLYAYI